MLISVRKKVKVMFALSCVYLVITNRYLKSNVIISNKFGFL